MFLIVAGSCGDDDDDGLGMTFDGGPVPRSDESRRASPHQLNIKSDVGVTLDVCEGRGRLWHNFPSFRSSADSQLSRMDSNGELVCIHMQSPRSGWARTAEKRLRCATIGKVRKRNC